MKDLSVIGKKMQAVASRSMNLSRYRTIGHYIGLLGQEERDIAEQFDKNVLDKAALGELELDVIRLRDEVIKPLLEAISKAKSV